MTAEPEISEDDIRVLRRDGDLSGFLRSLIRKTTTAPAAQPVPRAPRPRHKPGAWPAGTQPPDSAICHPDCPCALIKPPTQTEETTP